MLKISNRNGKFLFCAGYIAFSLLFCANEGMAHIGGHTIKGKVYKQGTSTPIGMATVKLSTIRPYTAPIQRNTNVLGEYSFTGLPHSTYSLNVTAAGCNMTGTSLGIMSSSLQTITKNFSLAPSATYSLTGSVTNGYTGAAISGATVTLSGVTTVSTTTNASGYYGFTNVAAGSYNIGVSKAGFIAYTAANNINISSNSTSNIALLPNTTTYVITASADTGGSISPNGSITVNSGVNQSFTITPSTGYKVNNVTVDSISKGAITSYTLTNVTANHTILATFVKTYTIATSAGAGGSISPNGTVTVNSGASQNFMMTPMTGYKVSNVLINGISQGSTYSNPYYYTFNSVTANQTISASFAPASYTITTQRNPVWAGTVSPATASYTAGSTVTCTATPISGYKIGSWTGADSTSGSIATVMMNNDRFVTANFVQAYTLSTQVSAAGGGTISKNPDQLDYAPGTVVTLTATPNTGRTFSNWSGDMAGAANSQTITMDGDKTVTATFSALYTLTAQVTPIGQGSVEKTPNQTGYASGTTVTLYPQPSTGYTFSGWSGDVTGPVHTQSITMNANKTVTANFVPLYSLTIQNNPIGSGGVIKSPSQSSYAAGTTVTLTATPGTGYTFNGWSGDVTGSVNPQSITMNGNKSVTANFVLATSYTLNTSISPSETGTVAINPDQSTYAPGTVVTLTAAPAEGYKLTSWSDPGGSVGSTNPLSITMNEDKSVTANFEPVTYTITAGADTNGSISPSGFITANSGASQTFTITPNTGYEISDVKVDGISQGAITGYTFTNVTSNRAIDAKFAVKTYTITASAGPNGSISPSGEVKVQQGEDQKFTFLPDDGYEVADVKVDGTSVGRESSYTVSNVQKDYTVDVTFLLKDKILLVIEFDPDEITIGDYDTKTVDEESIPAMEKRKSQNYPEVAKVTITALKWKGSLVSTISANETETSYGGSVTITDLSASLSKIGQKIYSDGDIGIIEGKKTVRFYSFLDVPYQESLHALINFKFPDQGRIKQIYIADSSAIGPATGEVNQINLKIPQYIDRRHFVNNNLRLEFIETPDGSPDVIQWMGFDIANDPRNENTNMVRGVKADGVTPFTAKDIFAYISKIIIKPLGPNTVGQAEWHTGIVTINSLRMRDFRNPYLCEPAYCTGINHGKYNSRINIFSHEFFHIFHMATTDHKTVGIYSNDPDKDHDYLIAENFFGLFEASEDSITKGVNGESLADKYLYNKEIVRTYLYPDYPVPLERNTMDFLTIGFLPLNGPNFCYNTAYIKEVKSIFLNQEPNTLTYYEHGSEPPSWCQINGSYFPAGAGSERVTSLGIKFRQALEDKGMNPIPDKIRFFVKIGSATPIEIDADHFAIWYEDRLGEK